MMYQATNQVPATDSARTPLEQADVSLSNAAQSLNAFIDSLESQLGRVLRPVPSEPAGKAPQAVGPVCSELVARFLDTRELVEIAERRLRSLSERLDV